MVIRIDSQTWAGVHDGDPSFFDKIKQWIPEAMTFKTFESEVTGARYAGLDRAMLVQVLEAAKSAGITPSNEAEERFFHYAGVEF